MQVVAFTKWLQSSYRIFSRFYVSYQTIPGDLHVIVHTGYPTNFTMMKSSAWIARLLFWVEEKHSTNMLVVNANLWWCCCAVDAEPWNNIACQHSVLPHLSSCNQYRICTLRTRRCVCPNIWLPYAYLHRLTCAHGSLVFQFAMPTWCTVPSAILSGL